MSTLLAIGAHPDDVEIGCGGVISAAAAGGARVVVADATAGERATHGTPEQREKERLRAADVLGVSERRLLGLPDTAVGSDPAHRDAIVSLLHDVRPRIVLAPPLEDRHPDHGALGRMVREACFLAGIGGEDRPARLYHYVVHHDFVPRFVVDVSATWQRKMDALRCYESQFSGDAPATEIGAGRFLEVVEARGVAYGSLIGAARGEAFWCPGPVPMRALPDIEGDGYSAFR